jgi:hypothetical protein
VTQGGIDALWVKETDRLSNPENLGDLSLISQREFLEATPGGPESTPTI